MDGINNFLKYSFDDSKTCQRNQFPKKNHFEVLYSKNPSLISNDNLFDLIGTLYINSIFYY